MVNVTVGEEWYTNGISFLLAVQNILSTHEGYETVKPISCPGRADELPWQSTVRGVHSTAEAIVEPDKDPESYADDGDGQ